jgi:hypothetical protein
MGRKKTPRKKSSRKKASKKARSRRATQPSLYEVRFYKGDYRGRQQQANNDGAKAYVEHHFNSFSATSNYTVVITGSNASSTSKSWGRWYAQAISREFTVPIGGDEGIKVGGFDNRGDHNLKHTWMPAILLEPLFASNPQHAAWIRSDAGQTRLARILSESIQRFFPLGGVIGFSVGHKYKDTNPRDRGAPVHGGGTEADYAEKVLKNAKALLEQVDQLPEDRELRVMQDGQILWTHPIDADAEVTWDPARGILQVN